MKALKAKEEIEVDTMKEGFRNILRAKFSNEWRTVKQEKLSKGPGGSVAKLNEC